MLLNQTDQATRITEEKVEDLSALVRRLNLPEKDRRVQVEQVRPTSNGFVVVLLGFIFVVLLAGCSVILYHKQQLVVRAQYDANQKKLLAEYRRNDSWRGAALALNNEISADLDAIQTMPIHNVSDFQEMNGRATRIKTALSTAPAVRVGLTGPGASYHSTLSGIRTQVDYVVRQRGCAFHLEADPDARSNAEWIVAESRLETFADQVRSYHKHWNYSTGNKRKEFQDQVHRLSARELKRAVLNLNVQNTIYYVGNPIAQLLKAAPYVPDGLDVSYARTLR